MATYDEPNENGQVIGLLSSGGGEPSMIADPKVVTDFDVSPDGEHVVYSTRNGAKFDDHVIKIDGSRRRNPRRRLENGHGPILKHR